MCGSPNKDTWVSWQQETNGQEIQQFNSMGLQISYTPYVCMRW